MPSPQEREGDRIPAHGPCTAMGNCGVCLHSLPGTPLPPTTLPHLGGRQHLTARFSVGLFLRVPGMATGGKPACPWDRWPRRCSPLGTRGTGQACHLPRLLPQSGARAPALVVPSCLLSSQASISPHRERVTLVLPLACCSCHGRLSCFPSVSRPQGQGLLLIPGGGVLGLPHTSSWGAR